MTWLFVFIAEAIYQFHSNQGSPSAAREQRYTVAETLSRSDIGSLLHVGTNTLYLNTSDYGGPAGFLFRATITTDDVVAPEPGTFGLGILALVATYALAGKFARKL